MLTSSRPRDKHKVTLRRGFLQTPHPFFVFVKSHMRTQTRRGNRFVCCRPGAQAPSLRPCYAHVPNQTASRVYPSSLQARPRGCVLVNLSMKTDTRLDENRFVRCSVSCDAAQAHLHPVHDGLLSTAPHLYLHHQPRHQPRVILQVCLAWCLFLAAAARTRLAPPLLGPTPPCGCVAWFRAKVLVPRRVCRGTPSPASCLPCAPARGLRCLLSLGFVCHGVDRIW